MSYLVLARKFRPQTFAALVGQEHISKALANSILRNRVPHALLFTGPRGVGKTSSARVFARALNCTGRALVEPCGECTNCVEIAKSSSMAVWEIDGASNNSVDNVRDLIDSLRTMPPPGSEYKIYIIDEVHMLSVAAFNALLKSLEEPPPNTIFIFATTEPHKIPDTVISRCQRHDFRRIPEMEISTHLRSIAESEKIKVDDPVFNFIARRAQGGMRDSQSMFDRLISFGDDHITLDAAQRVFGVLDHSFFMRISEQVFSANAAACFALVEKAFAQSLDVRTFLGDFLEHWRNLLLLSFGTKGGDSTKVFEEVIRLSSTEREALLEQLSQKNSFDMQRLFDIAEETVMKASQSMYPRYLLEAGLAKMVSLPTLRPIPELIKELRSTSTTNGRSHSVSMSSSVSRSSSASMSGSSSNSGQAALPQVQSKPVVKSSVEKSPAVTPKPIPKAAPLAPAVKAESQPVPESSGDASSKAENIKVVVAAGRSSNFNPSWQSFLVHVKNRRLPILEVLLKRISPVQFSNGVLIADASEFDRNSMMDSDTNRYLRDCLKTYSDTDDWTITFNVTKAVAGGSTTGIAGSVASNEAKEKKQGRMKIEKEARNDPKVAAVLEAFSGSAIERISILSK
ncbi:UNVERIFIED_CONTAM: hypothetical protein GTU68_037699 [Idotea baltica]|nr:hypothetical protein [Idotea baltica]